MKLQLFRRYDAKKQNDLRDALKRDFEEFPGGFPSYLSHMQESVAKAARGTPVSPDQVQSYKTISRFLVKNESVNHGTARFIHAYLQINDPSGELSLLNVRSNIARADAIEAKLYSNFRGRDDRLYRSHGIDVFYGSYPSLGGDTLNLRARKLIDGDLEDEHNNRYAQAEDGVDTIWNWREKLSLFGKLSIGVWMVVRRTQGKRYDIVHLFLADSDKMLPMLDDLPSPANIQDVRDTFNNIGTDWIVWRASGFMFWDALRFEARLFTENNGSVIEIRGFHYVRSPMTDGDFNIWDYISDGGSPYEISYSTEVRFHDMINIELGNMTTAAINRSGRRAADYHVFPSDLGLIASDPDTKRLYERALGGSDGKAAIIDTHGRIATSDLQLEKISPPNRTKILSRHQKRGDTIRQQAQFLKLYSYFNNIRIPDFY